MIFKNGLIPNVFDLSSLSRALEEIVLPQAGRLALAAFNVFDLSSLARALDEDLTSQAARFSRTVSDAFDLSSLSQALDEDIAGKAARPVIPAANIPDMSTRSRALNEDVSTTATVSNAFDLASLSRPLDENLAAQVQKMDTEQHKVTVNLISPHTMPPVLENPLVGAVTGIDLPTISAQKAEKLPIRDVPAEMNNVKAVSAREVDKAAVRTTPLPPIDMTIIASSSKTKVEDLNWRVGTAISKLSHRTPHRSTAYSRSTSTPSLPNVATISVKHNVASGTIIKRKLEDAFEIFETPFTKRKRTIAGSIEPLAHVPSRKRMLSDALESFELPAKKRKRYNDPESPVAPTLPTANCQSVISNDPELPVVPTLPTVN